MHRFFDERKRDYFVMYLHHIATIGLVGACRVPRSTLTPPCVHIVLVSLH